MKRTPFKRKSAPSFPRKSSLSRGGKGLRRGKRLRAAGKSETSEVKREIQAVLRAIVMQRDQGCILRAERGCGGELGAIGVVLQADHLISRSNSVTYADPRLVVCVCRKCHYWKSVGANLRKGQYDALVKSILPESRVKLWEKCERESWKPKRVTARDWALELVALKQELARIQTLQ